MRLDAIGGIASRWPPPTHAGSSSLYLHAMVMPEEEVGDDPHCSFSVTGPSVVGCQLIVVG